MIEGSTTVRTGNVQMHEEMYPLEEGLRGNMASCPILRKPLSSPAHDLVVNGTMHYAVALGGRFANNYIIADERATWPFINGFLIGDIVSQIRVYGDQGPYWFLDSTSEPLKFKPTWFPQELSSPGIEWSTLVPNIAAEALVKSQVYTETENALAAFGKGLENWVVGKANYIAMAALNKTVEPEITVDVDGALSFDLRLTDGRLVLAELEPSGALDASVYDQQGGLVTRLGQITQADLVALF